MDLAFSPKRLRGIEENSAEDWLHGCLDACF